MSTQFFVKSAVSVAIAMALIGCGGGAGGDANSSSSSSSTNADGETISVLARGFALPSEISAVPATTTEAVTKSEPSFGRTVRSLTRAVSALPSASDYDKTHTKRFVEERALEQFEIIEQVLNAIGQTNYADEGNVNQAPYTAMVAWVEENDGREVKTLEPWVIESRMIVVDGADVNRVMAWIEEPDRDNPGQVRTVKAEFKIYAAAEADVSGGFVNYGEWDLNVAFDDSGLSYFAASSRIDASSGLNTIQIHEVGMGPDNGEMKGVLVRSGTTGYGMVSYPDREACWGPGVTDPSTCVPPEIVAKYAYNAAYLGVDADVADASPAVFKDRNPANAVEMTHRYGLFYNETPPLGSLAGDDVEKRVSFGFPVSYDDPVLGVRQYAYYGAWQGRHELWGGDPNGIPSGAVVNRDDRGPNQATETFVVSPRYNGTFTQRSLAEADVSDIQGIPVETWINKNYDLRWNAAQSVWEYCDGYIEWGMDQFNNPTQTCMNFDGTASSLVAMTDFSSLVMSQGDRKWVSIGGWDDIAQMNLDYVYLANDPGNLAGYTVPGFYLANRDHMTGELSADSSATVFIPQDMDSLWVGIGGSIYIAYTGDFVTGTGWVQKSLESFDENSWQPVFVANGDVDFDPEQGHEYYINGNGVNYIVKRRDMLNSASDYEVRIELQTAANPVNVADFVPTGVDYFRTPWKPEVRFEFESDSASANFMKLVYASEDLATTEVELGTVYTTGEWGLQAYSAGLDGIAGNTDDAPIVINADGSVTEIMVDEWGFPDLTIYTDPAAVPRPTEYNWEYSDGGWGTQQFLCSTDCNVISNFELLSDPIQLTPLTVDNSAGSAKTLSLQFDGWMHGLPDLYHELSMNNWQMSAEISDKVISIPAGTAVTDGAGQGYYLKPLEVSVFLDLVPDTTVGLPDLTTADAVDLTAVPVFVNHNMGAKPTGTAVLYSEGNPVE